MSAAQSNIRIHGSLIRRGSVSSCSEIGSSYSSSRHIFGCLALGTLQEMRQLQVGEPSPKVSMPSWPCLLPRYKVPRTEYTREGTPICWSAPQTIRQKC